MINIADLRREYTQGGLRRQQLTPNPLDLFEQWLQQAYTAGLSDPSAASVATVDKEGQPHQRMMLLKQYDEQGFVFYTNLGSRKAEQINHNHHISLLFPWQALDRQIIITGQANRVCTTEVLQYFHSRPKQSQLAAWASPQSSPLASRRVLEHKFLAFQQKFSQGKIPLPRFWGGFRIHATSIEFWQGGAHRLHDRFLYQRQEQGWAIMRLAP